MSNLHINGETLFWICALTGSGMFVIQSILNLMGFSDHEVSEGGGDTKQLKWLSTQAIFGFLMMFGWTALTCQKEFNCQWFTTLIFAFLIGTTTVLATSFLFKITRKLQSPGNVFSIEETIGKEATVYQRIPHKGVGKISVSLHNLTHEIEAVSHNQEEICSFTRVQIIKKIDDKTVVVTTI